MLPTRSRPQTLGPDGLPLPPDPTMEKVLQIIEPTIGRWLNRPVYLREALQAPGPGDPGASEGPSSSSSSTMGGGGNGRLAALGNFAVEVTAADQYYHVRGADAQTITTASRALSTDESMLKLGQQMGLDAVFGPGAAAGAPGLDLAATVRAIMGAVFCDGGVIGVRMVLLKYRSFE